MYPKPGLAFAALLVVAAGCSATRMLVKGEQAPGLSTAVDAGVQTVDGAELELSELRADGAVLLVLLRGFS